MPRRARAQTAQFADAYEAHLDFVWRTLMRHGVEAASVDDATQEVFLVAYRRWGAWEGQAELRAWLYGVARRVASTHHRSRNRHTRKLGCFAASLPPSPPDLDARVDDRARMRALVASIDALEPRLRELFILADIEGLSAPAIAAQLDYKLNTIYSRLRRARTQVHAAMASYDAASPRRGGPS